MAEITKSTTASMSTLLPEPALRESELLAGEAIAVCDACYIKSDGLVWKATGAAANAAARVRGFALAAASVNDPVTLVHDVVIRYGTALTPGVDLFLSGTVAGGLADAASTGGTSPIAYVKDATRIRVLPLK